MRIRWRIALIWACFLARLAFYATMLPLWEGYDEWAHFSVIRTMALRGEPLVARDQPIPRDVAQSLELAPVPWELRDLPSPSVTEDAYWNLPAEARAERETAFRAMPVEWSGEDGPTGLTAYEALQPPLYYWMLAPVLRLMSYSSLSHQVMIMRWLSVLLVSSIIPLIFAIGREALGDERIALCCAAAVAVMPELAIDTARVGNECAAIACLTLLIWLGLKRIASVPGADWRSQAVFGIVLGLGLLAKAYFLTAIPAVLLLEVYVCRKRKARPWAYSRALAPVALAAAISGWWYWRNLLTTGTLSGLSESTMLRNMGTWNLLRHASAVPWGTAIDSILFSHLYFGGWSSLTVRSWMYHVLYAVILVAAFGVCRMIRQPAVWWLAAVYGGFWAGQIYNVMLLFVSKGLPGSMGWYLYAVVAAESVLCAGGLARIRGWAPAAGVALLGLLDLYTVHSIAIPYYTGMIVHKPGGAIAALHLAGVRAVGVSGAIERLTVFKGSWITPSLLVVLWTAYLAATIWLVLGQAVPPARAASGGGPHN